jgi:glycosyltransferase involved in cell wall biosynthesis
LDVRVLVLIPAYNEAASLPSLIGELRVEVPALDILVVDDGSEDDTTAVVSRLGVRWLHLGTRLGTGAAVRTGLRYAVANGYEAVVRLDGDGQHPAGLIAPLLVPLSSGAADVVVGSRYLTRPRPASVPFIRRLMHYVLGRILSLLTGRRVTDPTSGLWAFGPRAIALLEEHHPSGYPEPELMLFVTRNGMRVAEVPVEMRDRLAGRTSLTLRRTGAAFARLILLLAVVPLRSAVSKRR